MTRPLRDTDPSKIHLITVRTLEAALWMIPSRDLNNLLGGIVARYQEIFLVTIYAFIFTGNHYHMLLKSPHGHLDEFVENVNREIARRVNRRNNRRAKFWGRRYDDQVVLSDDDAVEALLYILTNPTKHGLISHPNRYPGFSCYDQLLDGTKREFEFTHHSISSANQVIKTTHMLVITPLPQFELLNARDRKNALLALINGKVQVLQTENKKAGKSFMTADSLRRQLPGTLPSKSASSPRPLGYSKQPELIREHKAMVSWIRLRYSEASFRYRSGDLEAVFPAFTFRPPIHRKPRVIPFGHLAHKAA